MFTSVGVLSGFVIMFVMIVKQVRFAGKLPCNLLTTDGHNVRSRLKYTNYRSNVATFRQAVRTISYVITMTFVLLLIPSSMVLK